MVYNDFSMTETLVPTHPYHGVTDAQEKKKLSISLRVHFPSGQRSGFSVWTIPAATLSLQLTALVT